MLLGPRFCYSQALPFVWTSNLNVEPDGERVKRDQTAQCRAFRRGQEARNRPRTRGRAAGQILLSTLVLLAVLALSSAYAQEVRVGVRAGPAFGFLNDSAVPFVSVGDDTPDNTNVRLGLHVGALAVVPISDRVALQPELLFVQKGGHFSRSTLLSYTSERYQMSYMQGQLLARWALFLPGPLSMHLVGGLTASRVLEGTIQRDVRTNDFIVSERRSLLRRGLVQHWDAGLLVGIGIGYPLGEARRVSLTVRYNHGLRSVFSRTGPPEAGQVLGLGDPPPLTHPPPVLRHDVLTASLSYTMPLRW